MEYPIYKLTCMTPKIAFDSLKKENPFKMLFTSGTLKDC